jgi:hypothetical protein
LFFFGLGVSARQTAHPQLAARAISRAPASWQVSPRPDRQLSPRLTEECVGGAFMAVLPPDIGLHPGNFIVQFADIIAQFLDPQGVQNQFLEPGPFADRQVLFLSCHVESSQNPQLQGPVVAFADRAMKQGANDLLLGLLHRGFLVERQEEVVA